MNTGTFDPFAAVRRTSRAYQELLRQRRLAPAYPDQGQVSALTGYDCGPPVIDLELIWRAALADESCPGAISRRRWLSPRRFANRWALLVGARDDFGGRIRVDDMAAFAYCEQLDHRVMFAAGEAFMRREDEAVGDDPIGAVLEATRGGAFAVMMIVHRAAEAAGLTPEGLREAVLERAREEAAGLDDIAAESLLSRVHRAIGPTPDH